VKILKKTNHNIKIKTSLKMRSASSKPKVASGRERSRECEVFDVFVHIKTISYL